MSIVHQNNNLVYEMYFIDKNTTHSDVINLRNESYAINYIYFFGLAIRQVNISNGRIPV